MLDAMADWAPRDRLLRSLAHIAPGFVELTLRALQKSTFIIAEGSRQALRERAVQPWCDWGIEARIFHFSTKRVHAVPPVSNEIRLVRSLLRRRPLPDRVKS